MDRDIPVDNRSGSSPIVSSVLTQSWDRGTLPQFAGSDLVVLFALISSHPLCILVITTKLENQVTEKTRCSAEGKPIYKDVGLHELRGNSEAASRGFADPAKTA